MSTLKTTNIAHPSSASNNIVLDSSGRALVGVSSANANGGILQLSSGITFPATQVLSTDPNTLDDYEEGTWTPSLGGNTTYNVRAGRYRKIGSVCTLDLELHVNTLGTGSSAGIYGIPFTAASGNASASAAIGYASNLATNVIALTFRIDAGSSDIANAALAASAATTTSGVAIFGNNTRVLFSITYITA